MSGSEFNVLPKRTIETESEEGTRGGYSKDSTGLVLGPDGKPCRTCTDFKTWAKHMRNVRTGGGNYNNSDLKEEQKSEINNFTRSIMATTSDAKSTTSTSTTASGGAEKGEVTPRRSDCPLDKGELGRNTWGFLHTMAAYYPENPTTKQQKDMKSFINIFAKFFPCEWCCYHLRERLKVDEPNTSSQDGLSQWFCDYHNEVNRRLGKEEFDCSKVMERWKTGWADGSCD